MGRQLFEYHPLLGYRFIPGLRARVEHEGGGYLVRVNQAGFRSDREFTTRRTPGRLRALLFGDSYTAGNGVSNRERFSDILETLLPELEIYNFGLPGSGTDQQYLTYRELAAHYEHDLVIVAPMVENIHRNMARYRCFLDNEGSEIVVAKPYFELTAVETLELRQSPVPTGILRAADAPKEIHAFVDRGGRLPWVLAAAGQRRAGFYSALHQWSRRQPLPAYDRAASPAWRLMKAILCRWLSEIRTPAVVCPLPLLEYVDGTASADGYRARFDELNDPPRVSVHDPLDALRQTAQSQSQDFRFATDPHPTPRVHRALADSLARWIGPWIRSHEPEPKAGSPMVDVEVNSVASACRTEGS